MCNSCPCSACSGNRKPWYDRVTDSQYNYIAVGAFIGICLLWVVLFVAS